MRPDEHQILFADRAAERDREREPGIVRQRTGLPAIRPGSATIPPRTVRLRCPVCSGPVYSTTDSNRELVGCTTCLVQLATRRQLDGRIELVLVEATP